MDPDGAPAFCYPVWEPAAGKVWYRGFSLRGENTGAAAGIYQKFLKMEFTGNS